MYEMDYRYDSMQNGTYNVYSFICGRIDLRIQIEDDGKIHSLFDVRTALNNFGHRRIVDISLYRIDDCQVYSNTLCMLKLTKTHIDGNPITEVTDINVRLMGTQEKEIPEYVLYALIEERNRISGISEEIVAGNRLRFH